MIDPRDTLELAVLRQQMDALYKAIQSQQAAMWEMLKRLRKVEQLAAMTVELVVMIDRIRELDEKDDTEDDGAKDAPVN